MKLHLRLILTRGIICIFLAHLFCCFFTASVQAAPKAPSIKANGAILLDAKTGEVLFGHNIHKRYAPASTTKIMTAILAIESGRLDEKATVSPKAAGTGGSSLHLFAGQTLTVRELVTGLMMRSGNDAAVAIAQEAMKRKTGARALRSIVEELMLDIMYEIPKDDNIGKVTITRDYVEGKGGPLIEIRGEHTAEIPRIQPQIAGGATSV